MTNSAKTRPTPIFDKKIEKQCETPPQFRPPGPEPTKIAFPEPIRRPKFEFPDESIIKPIGNVQFGTKPGGGERNRTDDLLLAKQALSQLS